MSLLKEPTMKECLENFFRHAQEEFKREPRPVIVCSLESYMAFREEIRKQSEENLKNVFNHKYPYASDI